MSMRKYLKEETRVLRELHGKQRLRCTNDERHDIAAKDGMLIDLLILNEMVVCRDTFEPRSRVLQAGQRPSSEVRLGAFDRKTGRWKCARKPERCQKS